MFRFICGRGGQAKVPCPPVRRKFRCPPKRTKTDPSVLSRDHGPACREKVREYLFYYFFVKRIRRERDGERIP